MKVLHICQRDDPDTGGALRVGEALVREQRAAGVDAWILFLYGAPDSLAKAFEPYSVCLGLDSSRQAIKGIRALKKAIQKIGPDIIHSHDGILWPRLAYLRCGIPIVTHAHAPPGEMASFKDQLGWPLTKKTTNCLIGISRHTINSWLEAGFSEEINIHLIPNGVDFDRFFPTSTDEKTRLRRAHGLPETGRIILWIGRLHNGTKGTDRVEQVAAVLPEGTTLVVVGQGPDYEGMCERCSAQIKAGQLVMAGSSTRPEDYCRLADLFLFTSYQDAFGLVILEAVASELPILAFPVTKGGGAVELLNEFDAIEMGDPIFPETLLAAIRRSACRSSLRPEAMRSYAWPALSNQVVQVYRSVIENGNNPK